MVLGVENQPIEVDYVVGLRALAAIGVVYVTFSGCVFYIFCSFVPAPCFTNRCIVS